MLAPKIVTNVAEEIDVFFRPPLALLGLCYALLSAYAVGALQQRWRFAVEPGTHCHELCAGRRRGYGAGSGLALGADEEESIWPSPWV
jgi:hypothetical protein